MKIYNISEIPEGLRVPSYEEVLLSGYTDGYDDGYNTYPCYKNMYFTIEAMEAGNIPVPSGSKWRVNKGEWQGPFETGTMVPVEAGDKIEISRVRNTADYMFSYKTGMPRYKAYGNAMSLVWGDDFRGKTAFPSQGGFGAMVALFESTKIVYADNLVLPATDVPTGGYEYMFYNCSLLVAAPELPATGMSESCYLAMFTNCTSLTTAPDLPATTLASGCYQAMFSECSSLVNAPELPATNLAVLCYGSMFANCTSLESAPELPAMTLATSCYSGMFQGCTSLVDAPELPATNLAPECYRDMFYGCTSLETAPELPAETLVDTCYEYMFNKCSSLNYVKVLATNILASMATTNWLRNVAPTGTFIHPCGVDWAKNSNSGIPSGWTEVNDCHDYSLDHTTMEIMTGGTIQFGKAVANAPDVVLDYSLDSGSTWTTITSSTSPYVIQVQAGDVLMFRGDNPHGLGDYIGGSSGSNNTFSGSTAYFKVYGNIMSLISRTGFEEMTVAPSDRGVFSWLFMDTNVVEAKNLVLPAASGDICFNRMFANCEFITESPVIPNQAAAGTSTYFAMFSGCTSLNKVTALMTNLGTNGTSSWMDGVAQTGTFIKNQNMNSWSSGASGIPTGWTIVNAT